MRIACTAFGTIKAGRPSKDGLSFVGNPVDVTSDCLKAVIEKVGVGKTMPVSVDGVPMYEIEVRLVPKPEKEAPCK